MRTIYQASIHVCQPRSQALPSLNEPGNNATRSFQRNKIHTCVPIVAVAVFTISTAPGPEQGIHYSFDNAYCRYSFSIVLLYIQVLAATYIHVHIIVDYKIIYSQKWWVNYICFESSISSCAGRMTRKMRWVPAVSRSASSLPPSQRNRPERDIATLRNADCILNLNYSYCTLCRMYMYNPCSGYCVFSVCCTCNVCCTCCKCCVVNAACMSVKRVVYAIHVVYM